MELGPRVSIEISTDPWTGGHISLEGLVPYTKAEKEQRLAEIAENKLENEKRERKRTKTQLIEASGHLDQAKRLLDDGLDAADVQAIQKEVDDLKKQLGLTEK